MKSVYVAPRYSSSLPVYLVKEYAYCPAIPWIREVLGYREPRTPSMEGGARIDAEVKEEIAKELGLPRPWRIEVPVRGRSLPLSGVIDIVAGERWLTIVEVKAYRRRIKWSRHFRLQLLVYAYLANELLGPVREAILYMPGAVRRYTVTSEMLEEARRAAEEALRAIESEEPPRPRQPARKCGYCWYRRVCPSHY